MASPARRTNSTRFPTDLRVIEVQHHLHVRVPDGLDERQGVLARASGIPGWSTMVFWDFPGRRDPGVGAGVHQASSPRSAQSSHMSPETRLRGQAACPVDEFAGVDDEPRNTQHRSGFDARWAVRTTLGSLGIVEVAVQVSRHRRRWHRWPARPDPCRGNSRSPPGSRDRRCAGALDDVEVGEPSHCRRPGRSSCGHRLRQLDRCAGSHTDSAAASAISSAIERRGASPLAVGPHAGEVYEPRITGPANAVAAGFRSCPPRWRRRRGRQRRPGWRRRPGVAMDPAMKRPINSRPDEADAQWFGHVLSIC